MIGLARQAELRAQQAVTGQGQTDCGLWMGNDEWLMRSTADRVVRGANVPVLLVRASKEKT